MKVYQTAKRRELLTLLSRDPDRAYTPEELSAALSDDGHGKSTVYRLLSRFEDEGVVRKITDGKHRACYQYIGTEACHHHLHLQCSVCGRLFHADEETTHLFEDRLKACFGFSLSDTTTVLMGRCHGCEEALI